MQEKKQEIYKIHCFYMGKIKKNDNLIIKDLMSSYKSRDLGFKISIKKNVKILSKKQKKRLSLFFINEKFLAQSLILCDR